MIRKLIILVTLLATSMQLAAQQFDDLPTPGGEEKVIDNTPDSIAKALMSRPAPGSTRNFYTDRPFVYIIQEASSGAIFFIGTFQGN